MGLTRKGIYDTIQCSFKRITQQGFELFQHLNMFNFLKHPVHEEKFNVILHKIILLEIFIVLVYLSYRSIYTGETMATSQGS